MTALSITFLILSILLVWGGLVASTLFLRAHPERSSYPAGGTEEHRDAADVIAPDL